MKPSIFRRCIILIGAVFITFLLVSSVTAVPNTNAEPTLKKIDGIKHMKEKIINTIKTRGIIGAITGFIIGLIFGLLTWIPAAIALVTLGFVVSMAVGFQLGSCLTIPILGGIVLGLVCYLICLGFAVAWPVFCCGELAIRLSDLIPF